MPPSADPVTKLRSDLRALEAAYPTGHHGRWAGGRRADLVDVCLQELWRRAAPPPGLGLAALGGYGRRLQLPGSDVDLLIVHEGADETEVRRVADAILYPLWDAGLAVGHAVRTLRGCEESSREHLGALTALLDLRPLAGEEWVLASARDVALDLAREDPQAFAGRLREDSEARRGRFGSCAHLLEPDLKQGTGGLRDIAALGWLAAAQGIGLGEAGLLGARELAAVDDAEEFLVRARSAVHLETGRRADVLLLELQPDVARGFGFVDEPGLTATDALMRSLFEHARDVEAAHAAAFGRSLEAAGEHGSAAPLDGPVRVLEALNVAAGSDVVPSVGLLDAIAAAPIEDPVVWTPALRDGFLRLIGSGAAGVKLLEALDRLGLLTRFLPCWRAVRCRPQRDPYHRYTVDVHLMTALAHMSETIDHVDHRGGLLLGALLHDIGKVGKGNHVPAGVGIAGEQLDAMSLEPADRDLAAFMVAEHLLLPDTATRRDLTDEDLIIDVAARIGTPERLHALELLAEADARATGPAAWTPWRQALVRELVTKVRHVLERGEMGEELAARLADRVQRVRDLLVAENDKDVDSFVLRMPRGYFLSVEPAQVARHFHTVAPRLGASEVRTASVVGTRPGTYELLVVANDTHGLLAYIAGGLAVGGISILSAQVFTTEDRVAVDLFEVEGAFDPEITEARWRAFRGALRRAVHGQIDIGAKVVEKRAHYPAPKVGTPVTVSIDNDASDFSTVVEVGAPDRIGLLHDITRTFADLGLDVHLAKVATYDGRVVDAFYVRDDLGRKLTDAGRLAGIEAALVSTLSGGEVRSQ